MESSAFDPDLVHAIFKHVWERRLLDGDKCEEDEVMEVEFAAGPSKKHRPTTANTNALKLSSELLRLFVTEAVNRAAIIAEAEGVTTVEPTHLERILPQLLLDF